MLNKMKSTNKNMNYYFNTTLSGRSFEEAIELVTSELKSEGFGVLTQIDVKETFKMKIDVDFKKYKILGACNPTFAHKALLIEDKAGTFLPCNIIVEENDERVVEVSAVDPVASMMAIQNEELNNLLKEVQLKLIKVINNLK